MKNFRFHIHAQKKFFPVWAELSKRDQAADFTVEAVNLNVSVLKVKSAHNFGHKKYKSLSLMQSFTNSIGLRKGGFAR